MKDFNFFEPYLHVVKTKSKENKKKSPIWFILKTLLAVVLISAPLIVFGSIFLDSMAIKTMNESLESPEIQEALQRVDEKRAYVEELNRLQGELLKIHRHLSQADILMEEQLAAISYSIPENVNIIGIQLSAKECTIEGTAYTREAVAEYEYNLRKTNQFDNLLVINIAGAANEFHFDMSFQLEKAVK